MICGDEITKAATKCKHGVSSYCDDCMIYTCKKNILKAQDLKDYVDGNNLKCISGRCPPGCFIDLAELAHIADDKEFKEFKTTDMLKVVQQVERWATTMDCRKQEQKDEHASKTNVDSIAMRIKEHAALKCTCGNPLDLWFENCSLVQCPACGKNICMLCLQHEGVIEFNPIIPGGRVIAEFGKNDTLGHQHVVQCDLNPCVPRTFWIPKTKYLEFRAKIKKQKADAWLLTHNITPHIARLVRHKLAQEWRWTVLLLSILSIHAQLIELMCFMCM